jgi:hypothetical protein
MPLGFPIGDADFGVCVNCGGSVKIIRPLFGFGQVAYSVKGGACQKCGARYKASQARMLQPRPSFTKR